MVGGQELLGQRYPQIERRVKAGNTEVVTEAPKERTRDSAQVIDLMAALKQSLESKPAQRKSEGKPATKATKARATKSRKRA